MMMVLIHDIQGDLSIYHQLHMYYHHHMQHYYVMFRHHHTHQHHSILQHSFTQHDHMYHCHPMYHPIYRLRHTYYCNFFISPCSVITACIITIWHHHIVHYHSCMLERSAPHLCLFKLSHHCIYDPHMN